MASSIKFVIAFFQKLAHDLLIFANPLLLKLIISFAKSGQEPMWKGILYSFLLLCTTRYIFLKIRNSCWGKAYSGCPNTELVRYSNDRKLENGLVFKWWDKMEASSHNQIKMTELRLEYDRKIFTTMNVTKNDRILHKMANIL